jgi:hypothetical protein
MSGATVLDAVLTALGQCAEHNSNTHAAPAVVLWPDEDRLWETFVPAVRAAYPAFLTLGDYDPSERTGPAIWLRCVLAGTLPEVPAVDDVPVLYLPGVSRAGLRAVASCPPELQPLVELQYCGTIWSQLNGKDWTPNAFLRTPNGGLGLDVASDGATLEALQQALPKLAGVSVRRLKGRRLEAADFRELVRPEAARDLLRWLDNPDSARKRMSDSDWSAFRGICRDEYRFDPETDGPLVTAERLGQRQDRWASAWRRYADAPGLYPHVAERLRQAAPKSIDPSDLFAHVESWPQFNEREEDTLRKALSALGDEMTEVAGPRLLKLEEQHARRRSWIWAELGQAPLAQALRHLAELVHATNVELTGGTTAALGEAYASTGWRADANVLQALAEVETPADRQAVGCAVRAIYRPWLERTAQRFQSRVQAAPLPSAGAIPTDPAPGTGECILFADGLRFDVGQMLAEALRDRGVEVEEGWRWAALPTVTPTAKPAASPVASEVEGGSAGSDFRPQVREQKKPLTIDRFRGLLGEQKTQVLQKEETGDPQGRAWAEYGSIDRLGHEEGAKLARRIPEEVRGLALRIAGLLAAGWKRVRVVTDHGWLLLPGGLPRVELPGYLAETRWGRCAVLKSTSTTDLPSFSWHWAPEVHVVAPHGIGCFVAGHEYAHGGLSLQECVVPVLTVKSGANAVANAGIEEVSWRGFRCRIRVKTDAGGLRADLRVKPGDESSSIALEPKPLDDSGNASLVVEDDSYAGSTVTLVLLDGTGSVIAKEATTVGG